MSTFLRVKKVKMYPIMEIIEIEIILPKICEFYSSIVCLISRSEGINRFIEKPEKNKKKV